MNYRSLAGERVSQLGFGAMRLPTKNGAIDEPEAIRMIRHAIDNGVNYVDTAWPYHSGQSELVVGKALQNGYRDKTFLATKSPIWLMQKSEDFDDYFERQLKKLRTDRIDFYLLHALNDGAWKTCRMFDAIGFCERMKKAGKIRHYGFSFHDGLPVFKTIASAHPWEFCQIQYNYLDRKVQAGQEGLEFARERNIDVIVMEPLRGGNLVGPTPPEVSKLWETARNQRSSVDWALRWVWDHKDVSLVLSGMSSMEQLKENLGIASDSKANGLTADERAMMDQVERLYHSIFQVGCTGCRYCMPCPSGVDIPRNFTVWNEYFMFGKSKAAKGNYVGIPESERADRCTECGACLELCPQHIDVPGELKRLTADLAG